MLRNDGERLKELARVIVAERIATWSQPLEFIPADEEWIDHLNRRFHAQAREQLEQLGFRGLGYLAYVPRQNEDDAPLEVSRFVIQLLVSDDGFSVATVGAFHFGARIRLLSHGTNRAGGGREICLSTELIDGRSIVTANSYLPRLPELRGSPEVDEKFLEPLSSPRRLFAAHVARVGPVADRAVRVRTLEDAIASEQREHLRKRQRLKSIGFVDPQATVDVLFADVVPSLKRVLVELLTAERDAALRLFAATQSASHGEH